MPEGFLSKLAFSESITLLNLMNHNAGFQETAYTVEVKNASEITSLETALLQSQPAQIYKPGTVTAYSYWGCALAALIVERVSQEKYTDYAHNHIFSPLQMNHTSASANFSDNEWVSNNEINCIAI